MAWQSYFVYGLVLVSVVMFLSNRIRLDMTAAFVILALALSGILTPAQSVAGFGNPLVLLIAGLFVVSEGLNRTGVAAWVGMKIANLASSSEVMLLTLLMPTVAVLSAFMSSTGVVALFIPVVLSLAREASIPPRRLLLPVAISSLIGGMLTLIGTPPNLVVNRTMIDAGFESFHFFDFTLIGAVILLAGMIYILVVGRHLLPKARTDKPINQRKRLLEMAEQFGIESNLHRLRVVPDSPLVGKTVSEAGLRRHYGLAVIAMEHKGKLINILSTVYTDTKIKANDLIVVSAPQDSVTAHSEKLGLMNLGFPSGLQRRYRESFGVAEALVTPSSPLIGKTLGENNIRRKYRLNALSLRRGGGAMALDFNETILEAGDIILVAGAWNDIERMSGPRQDLVILEIPEEFSQRTWHGNQAPYAVLITGLMLVLMVTQATSNLVAVMLAAFAMVATRCVNMEEAYRTMNWQSLVLIAGMLPLATALEVTGGSGMIVTTLTNTFSDMGPHAILAGLFLLTSIFSQIISNTATTVLVAPIALSLAVDLHYSPTAFLMTVAIAASTAFATPVASPVNTLIVAPGEYSFTDFLKVGVLLQLIALVITVIMVPLIFPL